MSYTTISSEEGHQVRVDRREVNVPTDGPFAKFEYLMPPDYTLTWPDGFELHVRGVDPLRALVAGW